METKDKAAIRNPMLKVPEWVMGRADGQFERAFLGPERGSVTINMVYGTALYRAGYLYGQLEREAVLTHLTILFTAQPWFLAAELWRLGGIRLVQEELERRGVQETIEEYLALLWPEKSRTS